MPLRRADDQRYALATGQMMYSSFNGIVASIPGGEYAFFCDTNGAGSGQVSLQMQSPSGLWLDVCVFANSVVRMNGYSYCQVQIDLPAGNVRILQSGGNNPINAWLVGAG